MTISSTPSASRNAFFISGSASREQRQLKIFSMNSTSSPFAGSFFLYRYMTSAFLSDWITWRTATICKNVSTPSSSPTLSAILLPSCRTIERISLAYCLLLSYAFCDTRFNSHGRSVVFSTICSARGGMNDKRFSRTPRIWNTPWESVSSFSSSLLRFATSKSSKELFS